MSPPKIAWTDDEIVATLTQNPQDIHATLAFLALYLVRLKEMTAPIAGLSEKVDVAIQRGVASAFIALSERPKSVSLFQWVWTHVEEKAQAIASFSL